MNFTLTKRSLMLCWAFVFCMGAQLSYAQPANDDCAGALTIDCDADLDGSTVTATATASDNPGCFGDSGIWYTFDGDGSNVTLVSTTTGFDHSIGLFSATSCAGPFTEEICRDASIGTETISDFLAEVGTTYYVYIGGFDNFEAGGDFNLARTCVAPPAVPANNECADAVAIGVDDVLNGTVSGATETNVPEGCASVGEGVWYAFAGTGEEITITVDEADDADDTELSIYSGTCGDLTNIACSDDPETLTFQSEAGTDYFIYVSDWNDGDGADTEADFTIALIATPPPPSVCDDAAALELIVPATLAICEGEEVEIQTLVTGGGAPTTAFQLSFNTVTGAQDFTTGSGLDLGNQTIVADADDAPLFGSFTYIGDVLYGVFDDGVDQNLITIDPATGAFTVVGPMPQPGGFSWFGMSYDQTSSTLYAIGGGRELYTIDIATGTPTLVGDLSDSESTTGGRILAIHFAIDANGNAYAHDWDTDDFYSIDLATGAATFIGETGVSAALTFQAASFSGSSYVAALANGGDTEYYIYDLTTGAATSIATLADIQVTGLAFTAGENTYSYLWSPAAGLSDATIGNPVANPTETTTYTLVVTDGCGQEATADVIVEVSPAALLSDQLNCKSGVNVSLDGDCRADLSADRILAGTYACSGLYDVDVDGTGSSIVTSTLVGQTVDVQVFVPGSSPLIFCWGTILVEDKLAPMIECEDISLPCTADPDVDAPSPVVTEPCGGFVLDHSDGASVAGTCTDAFQSQFVRTWTVTNASGMTATCTQTISIERADLSGITAAINYDDIEEDAFLCDDFPDNPGLLPDEDGNLEATRICNESDFDLPLAVAQHELDADGNSIATVETVTFSLSDIASNATVSGVYVTHADDGNLNYRITGPNGGAASFTSNSANPYSTTSGSLMDKDPEGDWTVTITNRHYDTEISDLSLVVKFKVPAGPQGSTCDNINFGFTDTRIDICEGTYKILRIWQVVDHCAAGELLTLPQTLKLHDVKGPTIGGLADISQSTDFDLCTTDVIIPAPSLSDDCSTNLDYSVTLDTPEGTLVPNPCPGCAYIVQGLPIGTHTVTYTAVDDCGNTSSESLDITVSDDVIPTAVCETNHVVSLHNVPFDDENRVPTLVDAIVFDDDSSDNCGILKYEARRMFNTSPIDFNWTTSGYQCNSDAECVGASTPNNVRNYFDEGEGRNATDQTTWYCKVPFSCEDLGTESIQVEFRVTDVNGNHNTCMVSVTVHDKVKPVIACPAAVTVDCHDDIPAIEDFLSDTPGVGLVPAYRVLQIVNGFATYTDDVVELIGYYASADNCSSAVYIREVGDVNNCGIGNYNRIFQAEDQSGNMSNTCIQTVRVMNSDPFLIVDTNPICTSFNNDTPDYPEGPHSRNDDVEWPCDDSVTCAALENNPDSTDPDNTGRPIITEDACDQVTVNYFDTEYTVTGSECKKISRKWVVTDWCQFQDLNGTPIAGYWEYTQFISVNDTTDPVFDATCDDIDGDGVADATISVDADPNSCLGFVSLTKTATDVCTDTDDLNWYYTIDPNNDGDVTSFITGTGNDASGNYPVGGHSIKWKVEDGCGNVSFCTQLFYVVDNAAPNLVVITSTDVSLVPQLGGGGSAELWASELNLSSFDNCSGDVTLVIQNPSLGLDQTSPPASASAGTSFDCADHNALGSLVYIDLWGRDEAGNWTYVIVQVVVEDNNGLACTPIAPMANVTGGSQGITTENDQAVENVTVEVMGGNGSMLNSVVTGNDGVFEFALPTGQNYTIHPERNDSPLNGISTYDLILMSQHILGINILDSPYKRIAADINQSGTITAFDILELRKLLLFINLEFPENNSWRFVDGTFVFGADLEDPLNPFASTFPEVVSFNDLTQDQVAEFVAIKTGDLNNSVVPNSLTSADTRTNGELVFGLNDVEMTRGQEYTVAFKANDFESILGYQFTMNFDQNSVEFVDVEAGALKVSADNFGFTKLNEGVITTSWNDLEGQTLTDDEVAFTVTFKALSTSKLSNVLSVNSRYTAAEAYDGVDVMDIALEFNGAVAGSEFALYQNQPNPFKNETTIGFDLPESNAATLTIYDVSGRVLKMVSGDFAQGFNQVTINRADLNGAGVLYYQLDTKNESATKKMILID